MSSSYLIKLVSDCAATFAHEPENAQNWRVACRDLGNLLQGMGRFEEAVIWHSLALDSEPNLAEIYAQLGRLYAQEEEWDAAIAFFEDALKSIPNSVHIYSNLAQIYGQKGDKVKETACWYEAVKINPDLVNGLGYYKLGNSLAGQGKVEQAIDCFQKACDRDKTLLPAHYKLAEIRLRQKDLDAAKVCFENIIEQDPNQPQAHYQLGKILAFQGKFEPASVEFRQTIKLDPETSEAYASLVQTFMQQQKWDEAISTCYSILNLVEEFPWVYPLLGNALRAKGKITEAAEAYQKACAARGWSESVSKNYFFPIDHFTYRMELFEKHLLPLANQEDFSALEVGNYLGMSACWLLDKVLTHPSAKLTCLDREFHPALKENLTKTGAISKVTLLEKDISQHLTTLQPQSFNLINLQEKRKQWEYIHKNTALAWNLVKVDGIIIFGGYGWRSPDDPQKNPKKGIDLFLNSIKDKWELIAHSPRGFQLIIRKIAKSDREV